MGFRAGTIDPEALEEARPSPTQEEEHQELSEQDTSVPVPPSRRLRAKTAIRFVAIKEGLTLEHQAQEALRSQDFSDGTFRKLVSWCVSGEDSVQDRRGDFKGRAVFGAYCHGGSRGLTRLTNRHPMLTRFMNQYLRAKFVNSGPDNIPSWTTLMVTQAGTVDIHRDFRNEWGSRNSVVCVPGSVELWIDKQSDNKVVPLEPNWDDSSVRVLSGQPFIFDPRVRHALRREPDLLLVAYTPLGANKLPLSDKACLEGIGFGISKGVDSDACVRVISAGTNEGNPDSQEESEHPGEVDLFEDLQEDSVAQVVGWDPVGSGSTNVPQRNLEERDLQEFLVERGVDEVEYHRLEFMGVESPADLVFLYFEDLVEFGIPSEQAERIMRGIHPSGTRRPDNPTLCSLTTGEVRLFDRAHRQIPWVFQNRTLDQRSPDPPVQGLGINLPDQVGRDNPDHRDWLEIEEARRRFEEEDEDTTEIYRPDLSAESFQSQVAHEACQ